MYDVIKRDGKIANFNISKIANAVRGVPAEYINEEGNGITEAGISYLKPLIIGEVDTVYENFVYQIAGDTLQAGDNESLQDVVERDEKIKNLKKQIEVLQARIRKEKQLNVQMKLNTELKKLKKELEVL